MQLHSFDSDPFFCAADKDHIRVDLAPGQTVTFAVTPVNETATLMELYLDQGTSLGITATAQLVHTAPLAHTVYYLAIIPPPAATFGCSSAVGYELEADLSPAYSIYVPLVLRNY